MESSTVRPQKPSKPLGSDHSYLKFSMKKRVVIVHAWGANPQAHWYPWLAEKLGQQGVEVLVPTMPETDEPEVEPWVNTLTKTIGTVDEQTVLVGHSIGGQTIMRYLETLPAGQTLAGVVYVAGWFQLKNLSPEEQNIARPWLETKVDFKQVKQHVPESIAFFSDNDPVVALDNQLLFEKNLGAKTQVLSQRGHFTKEEGITQLPEVLEAVLQLLK